MSRRITPLLLSLVLIGCSSETKTPTNIPDASQDGPQDAARDLITSDVPADKQNDGPSVDMNTPDMNPACAASPEPPTSELMPEAGELYYRQIGLGGFGLGEAAIVVGPQGGVAFIDIGNDSHDDRLLEVWARIEGATPRVVDYVFITHFHADHADGLDRFIGNFVPSRIVTRGVVDGSDVRQALHDELCEELDGNPIHDPICTAEGSCAFAAPAFACDTFIAPLTYPLGDAEFSVFAANGVVAGAIYPGMTGDSPENARSLVGQISYGRFQLLFAGDLNGGGDGTDDVETFYVEQFFGTEFQETEVVQSNHHGRESSNNLAWLDAFLPIDGRSRNVVVGVSQAHVGSPAQGVVDRYNAQNRLGDGAVWANRDATLGGVDGVELAGGGDVIIATKNGGDHYVVQTVDGGGAVLKTEVFAAAECQ